MNIPIRRISRFDLDKNQEEIARLSNQLAKVEKDLKNIKKVAIRYLKELIKKYGKDYPRRTEIQAIEQIDMRAMETRKLKLGLIRLQDLWELKSRAIIS